MATKTTERDWVEKIGEAAFHSIATMVAAADLDWDRLEELQELASDESEYLSSKELEEFEELKTAAGDCNSQEDAEERIQEDPLSIELGGWWTPGDSEPEASEYRILLTTGGPAVRIVGDLCRNNSPATARLEVQDWYQPWTEYPCDSEILLEYVSRLYLGE